jgi:hypothetical protein
MCIARMRELQEDLAGETRRADEEKERVRKYVHLLEDATRKYARVCVCARARACVCVCVCVCVRACVWKERVRKYVHLLEDATRKYGCGCGCVGV